MPPLFAASAIAQALGSLFRMGAGIKQNRLASKINPVFNQYQMSPFAQSRLGLALQLFNGRMFGAPQLERNILTNQGSALSNINKMATDASQALSYAAAAQGQTNNALTNLQTSELQNKYNMLNNLNNAYQGMVEEGDKVYQSMLEKYRSDVAQKSALRNASMNNIYGTLSDLASMGYNLGQAKELGLFDKNKNNQNQLLSLLGLYFGMNPFNSINQ